MSLELRKIHSAKDFPPDWDAHIEEFYQSQQFIVHTELYNPCKQRYYLFFQDGIFAAGVVVYTLSLNLFTYAAFKIPFAMNVVGIPCSVSASGFIGDERLLPSILELLKPLERGFLAVLNLNSSPQMQDIMIGHTLPNITMQNSFGNWEDYLLALRSDYRRRINMITASFAAVRSVESDCSFYTEDMHQLYLEVLNHSKGKLETLSSAFFANLPASFRLTAYYEQEKLLGWYICASYMDKFYFFLGGFDYQANPRYHVYFNLLYGILRAGIDQRFALIDLGQTAEIPKLRLGAKISPKWMLGYHSNFLIRKLLIAARGLLEYKSSFPETHTFTREKE